jgi:hypothetical protein
VVGLPENDASLRHAEIDNGMRADAPRIAKV